MSAKKDKSDKPDAPSNGKPAERRATEECFVIMPISDPDGYAEGHFRRVYEDLFVPACERAGYKAVRADEVRQTNLIHLDVLQKIIDSPMAICDLSNRNPNVLFELGLRQAFDKPVALVQEVGTPPIFDITPLRYTEYHREMLYRQVIEDQENITSAIRATKEAVKNSKSVNSIVKLLSLTHAASLANVSEGDKESAFFQVIMTELGNIRSEITQTRKPQEASAGWVRAPRGIVEGRTRGRQLLDSIAANIELIDLMNSEARSGQPLSPDLPALIAETYSLIGEAERYRFHAKKDYGELSSLKDGLLMSELDYESLLKAPQKTKS